MHGIGSVGVQTFPYNSRVEVTLKPPADGFFSVGECELVALTPLLAKDEVSELQIEMLRVLPGGGEQVSWSTRSILGDRFHTE